MAINSVTVAGTTNKVTVTGLTHTITPQVVDHTVTVGGTTQTVAVATQNVALQLTQSPVAVNVQPATIRVVTAASQGPQGQSSDEVTLLTKAERRDTVEDSPGVGDITIYDGIAAIGTANGDAAWLITRRIFLADGEAFDSEKLYASSGEDQVWDNRLSLTYT